ncbi:hypothetical protein BKA70DRAFT_693348 [Coprinopsis sp. MPI-PUGE-AT-0042]|nr:hypothetical protein BKA70DRAFT_693348 [Coprinopsis sp. MPI-PUGE-AT-0042]
MALHQSNHDACAPVHRMPTELLGAIFGHLLGAQPFRIQERQAFACLRSICHTWKGVADTTPNLCRGLEIDLDQWPSYPSTDSALRVSMKEVWEPWMALVRLSSSRHLKIHTADTMPAFQDLVPYFLLSTKPDMLTFTSYYVFSIALASEVAYTNVTCINLDQLFLEHLETSMSRLHAAFPNLQCLAERRTRMEIVRHHPPFQHEKLCTLHLSDVFGDPVTFAHFLCDLPALRELKISCNSGGVLGERPAESRPLVQLSLETLIVDGENSMTMLTNVTFPALRFFGFNLWWMKDLVYGWEYQQDWLPQFFTKHHHTCIASREKHKPNLTVSLKGSPAAYFLTALVRSLPSCTRLHLDICSPSALDRNNRDTREPHSPLTIESIHTEEIFCTKRTGDLRWLKGQSSGGVKIYIPSGVLDNIMVEERREELLALGYELEVQPGDVLLAMLDPSVDKVPWMHSDWELERGDGQTEG